MKNLIVVTRIILKDFRLLRIGAARDIKGLENEWFPQLRSHHSFTLRCWLPKSSQLHPFATIYHTLHLSRLTIYSKKMVASKTSIILAAVAFGAASTYAAPAT